MIALKRILVPHDFSETSAAAVRYAVALARNFGTQLYFLHVGRQAVNEFDVEFPIGLRRARLKTASTSGCCMSSHPKRALNSILEFVVRSGVPAAEIVRYAEDASIDLIVMGTHGRGFVGHVMMGSVAERVVRTAPCPVLTVRNSNHGFVIPDAVTQIGARAVNIRIAEG